MKRIFLCLISLLLILSFLASCHKNDNTDNSASDNLLRAENLMKDIQSPNNTNEPMDENGTLSSYYKTNFAVKLLQASAETDKNTLVSPLSVLYALAMTANGAKGETLSQMESVLGGEITSVNTNLHNYYLSLPQSDKYKLNLANSIWFKNDDNFTVNKNFLQTNADYYNSDIYQASFDNTTLNDINNWVDFETEGMIPKILDEIPEDAVMYLINALAFEAEWMEPYEKFSVSEGTFTLSDGTTQTVEFMNGVEYNYIESENAKGFKKYFEDRKYAFVALLPNEDVNINDYVASLTGDSLNQMLSNSTNTTVLTSIPVFETETSLLLNDSLKAMGMPNAFDPQKADFSNLGTGAGNVFINRVIHKTFINVGPLGAKAGAATLVEMTMEGCVDTGDAKTVYLDRPFVYMLIDCETNTPFFIGTMHNVK